MSELNIKIRKVQDNGSAYKANPDTLYPGGMRSAKVDRLRFEVPEEWKNCTISLPDPQLLDENYSVLVDRRWTLEAKNAAAKSKASAEESASEAAKAKTSEEAIKE